MTIKSKGKDNLSVLALGVGFMTANIIGLLVNLLIGWINALSYAQMDSFYAQVVNTLSLKGVLLSWIVSFVVGASLALIYNLVLKTKWAQKV